MRHARLLRTLPASPRLTMRTSLPYQKPDQESHEDGSAGSTDADPDLGAGLHLGLGGVYGELHGVCDVDDR